MNKKFKRAALLIAAVVVLTGLLVALIRPEKVETETAQKGSAGLTFSEDGIVEAAGDYDVYSPVSGRVLEVFFSEEDVVSAGDILLKIDPDAYLNELEKHKSNVAGYRARIDEAVANENNTKDSYRAGIAELESQLSRLEADRKTGDVQSAASILELPEIQLKTLELSIEQCQKALDNDKSMVDAYRTLYDMGSVSKMELFEYEQRYNSTEAEMARLSEEKRMVIDELERLKDRYGKNVNTAALSSEARAGQYSAAAEQIRAQISDMENNLGKDYKSDSINYYNALIEVEEASMHMLENKIEQCTVRAPKSGALKSIPVKSVSNVFEQALLFSIRYQTSKTIESFVSTEDAPSLSVGDKVVLVQKSRSGDLEYTGTISGISSWADEKVSALGVVEQKVRVLVMPDEDMDTVGNGYGLTVRFTLFRGDGLITVPAGALFKFDEKDALMVVKNGKLKIAAVEKGVHSAERTVILSGVEEGDEIVKDPSAGSLKEGMSVSISR